MSTTSKSPRKVALVAPGVGKDALPLYSHLCSPRKFTQAQLFVCLVLKEFFKTDYRGIAGILADSTDLRQVIGLQEVPHFTTIQKAAPRLLRNQHVQELLDQTVRRARPGGAQRVGSRGRAITRRVGHSRPAVPDARPAETRGPSTPPRPRPRAFQFSVAWASRPWAISGVKRAGCPLDTRARCPCYPPRSEN